MSPDQSGATGKIALHSKACAIRFHGYSFKKSITSRKSRFVSIKPIGGIDEIGAVLETIIVLSISMDDPSNERISKSSSV